MSPAFVSRCISDALDKDAIHVSELGADTDYMDADAPNRMLTSAFRLF